MVLLKGLWWYLITSKSLLKTFNHSLRPVGCSMRKLNLLLSTLVDRVIKEQVFKNVSALIIFGPSIRKYINVAGKREVVAEATLILGNSKVPSGEKITTYLDKNN